MNNPTLVPVIVHLTPEVYAALPLLSAKLCNGGEFPDIETTIRAALIGRMVQEGVARIESRDDLQ